MRLTIVEPINPVVSRAARQRRALVSGHQPPDVTQQLPASHTSYLAGAAIELVAATRTLIWTFSGPGPIRWEGLEALDR